MSHPLYSLVCRHRTADILTSFPLFRASVPISRTVGVRSITRTTSNATDGIPVWSTEHPTRSAATEGRFDSVHLHSRCLDREPVMPCDQLPYLQGYLWRQYSLMDSCRWPGIFQLQLLLSVRCRQAQAGSMSAIHSSDPWTTLVREDS